MIRFFAGRLLLLLPTFAGVTLVAFAFIHLIPGDPIEVMVGERSLSPERHAEMMARLGLDRPLTVQYLSYVLDLFRGDLGHSLVTRRPVLEEFLALFPATLELSLAAILLAVGVGLPVGMLAAVRRGSIFDHAAMTAALTGYSMPIFWWGLLLIILFSGTLGWTPVSGRIDVLYFIEPVTGFMLIDTLLSGEQGAFASALSHLVLPAIALGTIPLAVIARQTRSAMLEVLGEDYVRTARAKGLGPVRVVGLHALRNALIPVVTVIGLQVGVLLAGATIPRSRAACC
jgi:dipeptide transport system permease protein